MSSFLFDLGRTAYRRRWRVVGAWVVLAVLLGGLTAAFSGKFQEDFDIPGTPSQTALDRLNVAVPELNGASGTIVVVSAPGEKVTDENYRSAIATTVDRLDGLDFINSVSSPFPKKGKGPVSDDKRAAIINFTLTVQQADIQKSMQKAISEQAASLQKRLPPGARAVPGGGAMTLSTVGLSPIEAVGIGIALIVLLITLGSLRAAGMPLVTAIIGVVLSMLVLMIASGVTLISPSTPMLAVMLGLAVGIDYALFIVSRHREQLLEGADPMESAGRAVATAGSAVVFAGLTVIIALVGLAVANIPFLTLMGVFAAVAVAFAVLIALTLLPALLGFAGEKLRPKRARQGQRQVERKRRGPNVFALWVAAATKIPLLTVIIVVVGLGALAIPSKDLWLALPTAGQRPPDDSARQAYDLTGEHFGVGRNGLLIVTADILSSHDPLPVMADLKEAVAKVPGVQAVPLSTPNRDASLGVIQVVPTTAPESPETVELVKRLRAQEGAWKSQFGVTTAVTGATAVQIDISERLGSALVPFGIFVVGLSLVLLTIVFRSIWVPIKATLGYLLSVAAAFGATTLVFNEGVGRSLINLDKAGPVISFFPILLMGILFGLAMDYEVFLVSRMREEYTRHRDATRAVRQGFVGSAPVVVAAAVIMFAVFAFFVPEGQGPIKPIAFGLAVGVALDAFVVRMTLVPAVLQLLGDRAWRLPSWLERRLPSLDVEGEGVHEQVEYADWPRPGDPHAIYAENLGVGAGSRLFAAPVDLAVLPGQILVVSGEVGARRPLLLALAGRMPVTTGRAKILGQLLGPQSAKVRSRVAFIDAVEEPDVEEAFDGLRHEPREVVVVDGADTLRTRLEREQLAEWLVTASQQRSAAATVLGVADVEGVLDLLPGGYLYLRLEEHAHTDLDPDLLGDHAGHPEGARA